MTATLHSGSGNVLAVKNAECLLQRLNLLLAPSNTVLIAHARVHTGWLKLLVISKRCVKLLLGAVKVRLLLLERLLLILLLGALVLNVLGFLSLVDRRVSHELVVLLLCLGFRSTCLRLEPSEIALDYFDHADNAAILASHTLVGLVEDLRLLHQRRGIRSLGIEILQHAERLSDCSLSVL